MDKIKSTPLGRRYTLQDHNEWKKNKTGIDWESSSKEATALRNCGWKERKDTWKERENSWKEVTT